ncbi:sensor histidine kinase [Fictibacillus aquaticus]|uniref:histidine kinase n=1 Tax=Fictibacillus aquaticus TaxID=2021314 RepID=A0A235FEY9_9BACL|nr:ATP-binding protein [Fictibacillus aquaticus]OYD59514.1 two-component sensor histidine kinase [Fictibacillus aquaticus]
MTYNKIKWLILLLPTLSVGLWEYVRHTILEPYLSMTFGNYLSGAIVFLVTLYFLNKLFGLLEKTHRELQKEREEKAVLEEREKVAKELHDGIAQSLFFLSVKLNKLGKEQGILEEESYLNLKKTLQHVHEDTRQAIHNLRYPQEQTPIPWTENLHKFLDELERDHQLKIHRQWELPEQDLSPKEKVELFACVKEALINVIKHAETDEAWVNAVHDENGWICSVKDNGKGMPENYSESGYGLKIVRDRIRSMGWSLQIDNKNSGTKMVIQKGGAA